MRSRPALGRTIRSLGRYPRAFWLTVTKSPTSTAQSRFIAITWDFQRRATPRPHARRGGSRRDRLIEPGRRLTDGEERPERLDAVRRFRSPLAHPVRHLTHPEQGLTR